MPYAIELISVGTDLYPVLERAADQLNAVQHEFQYRLVADRLRPDDLQFSRDNYLTTEVWDFLRAHRESSGGHRPFVIAFVAAPLESPKWANLFGSHQADEGLVVVSTAGWDQYVRELRRYCAYYLVRYTLSFINPTIKGHNEPERRNCYFHFKQYKPEIRASMDSGHICDRCQNLLDNPTGGGAKRMSADEREALAKLRQVVAGDYPHAIVMKGGGVKGIAFAAALLELEPFFWFDRHVGASAGAIAAVLLSAGYSPREIRDLLLEKRFSDFMDASFWQVPFNLILRGGLFPGEHFRNWISDRLTSKIKKEADVQMLHLNGALLYASRPGSGAIAFDSTGLRKDTVAAFATRCSMSIPGFFIPEKLDGRRIYDGGLRNNFPVTAFRSSHPGKPFIALYLTNKPTKHKRWLGSELLDIVIDGEEREVVDKHRDDVVVIDPSPIGMVDFRLTQIEKEFLLKVGRASALRFLQRRQVDDGPSDVLVEQAEREAEECRADVVRLRKRRRLRRLLWLIAVVGAIIGIGLSWQ